MEVRVWRYMQANLSRFHRDAPPPSSTLDQGARDRLSVDLCNLHLRVSVVPNVHRPSTIAA